MSEKTRRFFISDVHLGGDESSAWFKPVEHEPALLAFLDYVSRQREVKDLVFLGDLFDTWMWPMSQKPQSLVNVVQKRHPAVLEAVRKARMAAKNIFYVSLNPDMEVNLDDLKQIFGDGMVQWIPAYQAGLLYAEHGSRFTLQSEVEV